MKNIIYLAMLMFLISCASKPSKIFEITYLDDVPDWTKQQGFVNNEYVAIGEAQKEFSDRDIVPKENAIYDGKVKLMQSAPANFKSIVMKAIQDTENSSTVDFNKMDIVIQELRALQGFKVDYNMQTCLRKTITIDDNTKYYYHCFVKVSIPTQNLINAITYTLESKYQIKQVNEFKDIMQSEVQRLMQSTN